MKELGIYIHIPFCMQKCYYCDFISFANKEGKVERYIEKVKKEISEVEDTKYLIKTIYFGGGTPSYIKPEYVKEILEQINQRFKVLDDVEITIEINPGTVDEIKLQQYKKMGINRISIGLQTSNDNLLKEIGRIHTFEEFLDTYKSARKVGFNNINVDLMLGLPNQTLEILKKTVEIVEKLHPEHISIYSLIVEEGTVIENKIRKGILKLPEEEVEREMYWVIKRKLEDSGYSHYEISNFAKKGYESKHNLDCWNQKEYLGFGLAAHSYVNKKRFSNVENLEEYISQENFYKNVHEVQNKENEMKEFVLLGLRKIEGIKFEDFKTKFSEDINQIFDEKIKMLQVQNLLKVTDTSISLSDKGIDLANQVWEEFI